jgi:hypothetical protein
LGESLCPEGGDDFENILFKRARRGIGDRGLIGRLPVLFMFRDTRASRGAKWYIKSIYFCKNTIKSALLAMEGKSKGLLLVLE